jgi:hypothetical protein
MIKISLEHQKETLEYGTNLILQNKYYHRALPAFGKYYVSELIIPQRKLFPEKDESLKEYYVPEINNPPGRSPFPKEIGSSEDKT